MAHEAINPRAALTVIEEVEAALDYDHPVYESATVTLAPAVDEKAGVFYLYTEQAALGAPLPDGTVRVIYKGQRLRVPTDKLTEYRPRRAA